MDSKPIEIDHKPTRDALIQMGQLEGADEAYTLYYNETNNIRKFCRYRLY